MNEPIDYPRLVQDALRQVVRQVLGIAADSAPGSFHLYVGFNTRAPGVELPAYLRDLFPEEMRIVLQHQFWDLEVDDEGFSVMLSFNAARHRLSVPFTAVTAFFDAEQDFALRFAAPETEAARPPAGPPARSGPQAVPPQAVPPQAVPPQAVPPQAVPPQAVPPQAVPPQAVPPQPDEPAPAKTVPTASNVVSFDAFRKK